MPERVPFKAVHPIGDTDTDALPVEEIGPAIGYDTQALCYSLISMDRATAVLIRDDARIGLAVNGRDPEQASCDFAISDVDASRRELDARGVEPGVIDVQEHEGNRYRVFFAREPYCDCFYFGQPAEGA